MAIEQLIQCPDTKTVMRRATENELANLRQCQEAGGLFNRLGRKVTVSIEEGFVSEATGSFFCMVQGVVWLVAEEAIPLQSN
jgi:hypothetical protein